MLDLLDAVNALKRQCFRKSSSVNVRLTEMKMYFEMAADNTKPPNCS